MKNIDGHSLTPDELAFFIRFTLRILQAKGRAGWTSKAEKREKILQKRALRNLRHNTAKISGWCSMEEQGLFSIGELAHMVGVSVRTLQYYDEQDLLKPIVTEGGRRKYTREDILHLEQILFLKSFGFSLEEIKDKILDLKTSADFEKVFSQQRKVLTEQIENLSHIVGMIDTVIAEAKTGQEINMDRLITIMESIKRGNPFTFVVRYFDDEQLKSLAAQLFGTPDRMDDTKEVFYRLEELYGKGADPAGKEGQELAKRWVGMIDKFTAGDHGLLKPLLYAGRDIENWPDEAKNLKEAIENFLVKALNVYLHHNGIHIAETESHSESVS